MNQKEERREKKRSKEREEREELLDQKEGRKKSFVLYLFYLFFPFFSLLPIGFFFFFFFFFEEIGATSVMKRVPSFFFSFLRYRGCFHFFLSFQASLSYSFPTEFIQYLKGLGASYYTIPLLI